MAHAMRKALDARFPLDYWRAFISRAGVVELVDAPDSKFGSERSVGSIPTARTTHSLRGESLRGCSPVA